MLTMDELLRRPAVIAAVAELGVATLGVEDVLTALHRFGVVRIEVGDDPRRPYVCIVQVTGEEPERAHGTSVLHAALACWAATLESAHRYGELGLTELELFLGRVDEPHDGAD
jgi:hypothetical protein